MGDNRTVPRARTAPHPSSSPPLVHNGACARRGDTNDPAPKLWGLQSRPLCFPSAVLRSWGLRPPSTMNPTVNTVALEKSRARAISLSTTRPHLRPHCRVFTCAVPRGACCRAGNAGMEARAGEWEGLRALPETARYSDPGPPLRTGVEALAQQALGAQLRGEERGGGRARGTCLGREGRARRHFRRGRDRGLQRRSRPSAAPARPQLSRLHPRRLGPWVSGWDPRPWRTTRVSQEGQWAASFPHLRLYLRIFKSQEQTLGPNAQVRLCQTLVFW